VRRLPTEEPDACHTAIDEAVRAAGRDPGVIVRACDLSLTGAPETWPDQIGRLATGQRASRRFFLDEEDDGGDPVSLVRRPGEQTAPCARELLGL